MGVNGWRAGQDGSARGQRCKINLNIDYNTILLRIRGNNHMPFARVQGRESYN